MNPLPVYRPPNPPARRSGVVLLILGGLALLIGLAVVAAAMNLATLSQNSPELRQQMEEIRQKIQIEPRILFIGAGVMFLTYAVLAMILGALVRGGRTSVIIITLIFTSLAGALAALNTITGVRSGPVALVLPLVVTVVHGLLIRWLIQAISFNSTPTASSTLPPPTHQPLGDYYTPPLPPPPTPR